MLNNQLLQYTNIVEHFIFMVENFRGCVTKIIRGSYFRGWRTAAKKNYSRKNLFATEINIYYSRAGNFRIFNFRGPSLTANIRKNKGSHENKVFYG